MSFAADIDLGPLIWVKGEIDLAFARTSDALTRFAASPTETAQLRFAHTHLHQARGALAIVGLDGVTHVAETLELFIAERERSESMADTDVELCQRVLATIRQFLDELVAGGPNQPLKLYPVYEQLQRARGQVQVSPSDLFFPDLSLRPPKREAESKPLAPHQLRQHLRIERTRFERGFLQWLRATDGTAGLADMRRAVAAIECTQDLPTARAFWWITLGFLDALSERVIPLDVGVKRLCARIDAQMRRLVEGSRTVAERLTRDVLYYVAIAEGGSEQVRRVQDVYRLEGLLPKAAPGDADKALSASQVRELRETLAAAKEAWDRFCAGAAVGLPQFEDQAGVLASRVQALHEPRLTQLAVAVHQVAQWLRKDPLQHNEAVAMEVATSLLLVENIAENFEQRDDQTVNQADTMAGRLARLREGERLTPLEAPLLGEISRRAQERLLMSQVAREIQTNLAQIEQSLDAFFRDNGRHAELNQLATPLRQVKGALTMLNQDGAVGVLRECEAQIARFASGEGVPSDQFEDVAHKLSALGFFVEALQHGRADLNALLQPQPKTIEAEVEEPAVQAATVEQELEHQRRDTQALVEALKDKPEDDTLRRELKQSLETIRQDASLLADAKLEQQARDALAALAAAPGASSELEQAVANIVPEAGPAPAPSPEASRLAASSSEEIDAELLEIFIAEAHEVLGSIGENLERSRGEPHSIETLTTIRRGFHTLKGSGRMVGLKDFGEAAWGIEQVMNRWLQQEKDATPALHKLIGDAHSLFSAWVAQLESGGSAWMDATELLAFAERIKAGDESVVLAVDETITVAEPAAPTEMASAIEAPSTVEFQPVEEEAPAQPVTEQSEIDELIDATVTEVPLLTEALSPPAEFLPAAALAANDEQERAEIHLEPEPAPAEETVALGELTLSRGLYDMFVNEARSHVATLRRELARIHLNPALLPSPPTLRAAHTLGGIAGTIGLEPVKQLARSLEQALARLAEANAGVSADHSETLNAAASSLEAMVGAVAERRAPQPAEEIVARLDRIFIVAPSSATAPEVPAEISAAVPPPEPALTPASVSVLEAPAVVAEAKPKAPPPAEPEERRVLRLQDDIDEQLLPIFLEEAQDLVREISAELRQWHADPNTTETPKALSRLLHTLKGSARMAGAMGLGELVHSMETRIDDALSRAGVTPVFLDEFDTSFDRVTQMLEQLRTRGTPTPAVVAVTAAPETAPAPNAALAVRPAAAPAVAPQPNLLEEGEVELAQQRASLRVRADLIDRFVNEAGEMSIARARIEGEMRTLRTSLLDLTENVIRLRRQLRELEIQAETQMQTRMAQAEESNIQFDPLEFDRFTRLQELTRMMAESVNDVSTVQHNLLRNLDGADAALVSQGRLNRDLAQALMGVRMVPFNSIAERLYRVVRQTAKELGKKANLDIRGGQAELDRSVLEKMVAPLEHLLRNAISHGLEATAIRHALGKPEIGQIVVQVSIEGTEVAIELADDGAGLDFEGIQRKAVERGLLVHGESRDERTLAEFIFAPGFSTAEELSEVAGRGIGMDVVKSQTVALGGRIDVTSERRKGARFHIYLPQTLAVTQALLVRSGAATYAIPSTMVEQVQELKAEALAKIVREGKAEWLGANYPYHYLPRLLGDSHSLPQGARYSWVLLLRSGAQRIALHVDELGGNQEVVLKNIGPQLARVVGITGATVLGNGEIVLILNPVALAGRQLAAARPVLAPVPRVAEEAPGLAVPGTIMVVDDSLTVRKITGRLLEREGYRVVTAKDGVDALEQLLDVVPDVMLVDIEMPRMDGFDLTRNVRADARLAHVPIIMITSRIAEKHRAYAREIGVNYYLGKPYQEEELLAHIAEFVKK